MNKDDLIKRAVKDLVDDEKENRPKPPGLPMSCKFCGYVWRGMFQPYMVITCPACRSTQ